MLNLIPRPLHAVLDYAYGAMALAAPKVLGFDDDEKARFTATALGVYALKTGLFSQHEGGLVKLLPYNTHLKIDTASAALTLFLPWLLGFANNPKARNTIIALALIEAVVVALSRPDDE